MEPCTHCNHPAEVGIVLSFDEPPEIVCDQCLVDLYPELCKRIISDRAKILKLP